MSASYPVLSRHNAYPYHVDQREVGPIKSVVFSHFCDVAHMTVEVHDHRKNDWQYKMSRAPAKHTISAEIT